MFIRVQIGDTVIRNGCRCTGDFYGVVEDLRQVGLTYALFVPSATCVCALCTFAELELDCGGGSYCGGGSACVAARYSQRFSSGVDCGNFQQLIADLNNVAYAERLNGCNNDCGRVNKCGRCSGRLGSEHRIFEPNVLNLAYWISEAQHCEHRRLQRIEHQNLFRY
ncbi:hypothetical protein D3C75_886140 [compost metagenome]